MGDSAVAGDDQIQALHHGGRVQERARRFVQPAAQVGYREPVRQRGQLLRPGTLLQAQEPHAGDAGQRLEVHEGDRTVAVVAVLGVALPGNADLDRGAVQLLAPVDDEPRVGEKVWDLRGHLGEGGAEDPRQAQERGLHIEQGQGGAARHQLIDAAATR